MAESSQDDALQNAKSFLMKAGSSGLSVYDHLTSVLTAILDQRQENAVEYIEDISKDLKANTFKIENVLKDVNERTQQVQLAQTQIELFTRPVSEEEEAEEKPAVPNIMEHAIYFEDAGVGLGQEETFRIFLALKTLPLEKLQEVRFWGKIFGLEANYIVAEAEYKEGEAPAETEAEEEPPKEEEEPKEGEEDVVKEVPIPQSQFKAQPPLPSEALGFGVNKKIYFVCREPGFPWILLPNATPAQIVCARKVKKFFTGNLSAQILSFPPFPASGKSADLKVSEGGSPGPEAEYLRAQIARITADVILAPLGFYALDEADDEDGSGRDKLIQEEEFASKTNAELMDSSMWAHTRQCILDQGRCKYIQPVDPYKKTASEDGEEEEEAEDDPVEPETGLPLLSPCQSDPEIGGQPAWTAKTCKAKGPYSAVVMSSNKWPGAHTFCKEKLFESIYIGYGHEFSVQAYNPIMPPLPQTEWVPPTDEEEAAKYKESVEPTPAEEQEYANILEAERLAREAANADAAEEADGAEGGGDEE